MAQYLGYIPAVLCIALMVLSLMLIVFSLPGTWVILLLAGLWAFCTTSPELTGQFFLLLAGLAVTGEVLEFLAGHFGTKRFGGSNKGSVGGIVGAIAGSILCAPLLFGFGALLGALAGGFAGCFTVEKLSGKESGPAARAAFGATLGRFGGFVVKLGIGIAMIWLSAPRILSGL